MMTKVKCTKMEILMIFTIVISITTLGKNPHFFEKGKEAMINHILQRNNIMNIMKDTTTKLWYFGISERKIKWKKM
uniref:Putative secreted protein n=1 Tax=Xenopsylla cheopis TaxID=163159 RepID=A0A6M2DYZ2_XENCH